jgi:hypothetical protein
MNSGYGAMSKSPQHPRDRGGVFTLKNPDDGSPIREQIVLGGRLLSITEKCVYGRLTDQHCRSKRSPLTVSASSPSSSLAVTMLWRYPAVYPNRSPGLLIFQELSLSS